MSQYLIVRHTVADYDKWRPFFDGHKDTRLKYGIKDLYVMRDKENPLDITTFYEIEDYAKAIEFGSSDDFNEKLKAAGATSIPTVQFLSD